MKVTIESTRSWMATAHRKRAKLKGEKPEHGSQYWGTYADIGPLYTRALRRKRGEPNYEYEELPSFEGDFSEMVSNLTAHIEQTVDEQLERIAREFGGLVGDVTEEKMQSLGIEIEMCNDFPRSTYQLLQHGQPIGPLVVFELKLPGLNASAD